MFKWKLRDVVAMVILAIVCGALFRLWDVVTTPVFNIAWVPATALVNGLWWIAAGLIPLVIQKPGAAFIGEVVAAVVEFALGGPYGISGILSGVLQGFGAEIAFALFRWRRYNAFVLSLSGILAGVGYCIQWYVQYKGDTYSFLTILLYVLITFVSGVLFGGFLPKWIGNALVKTGIVRNFALGKIAGKKTDTNATVSSIGQ